MTEPVWIRPDIVQAIHRRQIAEHGGPDGVRDPSLLDSAPARPRHLFDYGDPKPDLAALAAAYAFGIARNHPFFDGNKRTAYVTCRTFLILNGRDLTAPHLDRYSTFMALASGDLTEDALANWLRHNTA